VETPKGVGGYTQHEESTTGTSEVGTHHTDDEHKEVEMAEIHHEGEAGETSTEDAEMA